MQHLQLLNPLNHQKAERLVRGLRASIPDAEQIKVYSVNNVSLRRCYELQEARIRNDQVPGDSENREIKLLYYASPNSKLICKYGFDYEQNDPHPDFNAWIATLSTRRPSWYSILETFLERNEKYLTNLKTNWAEADLSTFSAHEIEGYQERGDRACRRKRHILVCQCLMGRKLNLSYASDFDNVYSTSWHCIQTERHSLIADRIILSHQEMALPVYLVEYE